VTGDEAPPTVSVVVPTFNRGPLLPRLAQQLTQQVGVGDYEIIFVDDASTDDTAEVLERLASQSPVPMRRLRTPASTGNPARPRNLGWKAARAPVVAFIDDDCLPQTDWLTELVRASDSADLVQGLTDADPVEAPSSGPFARFIVVTEFSWKFETCNIAYRKELLERLGGFDEGFPLKFGEDIDLGWRATAAHARLAFSPQAVVFHRVEKSGRRVRDWLNWVRYARHCELVALTVRKHPGIREHLYWRYFYKPYHLFTFLALIGLVVTPRARWWASPLVVPWVYYRSRVLPRPAPNKWLWAVLPMGFAVDVAEVVATLRGAVRYRRLVV
jgi:GT2 family glycosyltransferase